MKKYVILALISSFIGIMANPEMLMASDRVNVTGLDSANIVETVLPEPVVTETGAAFVLPENRPVAAVNNSTRTTSAATMAVAPVVANSIRIGGRTINTVTVPEVDENPGSVAKVYTNANGGKFVYAHNSANLFGVLYSVKPGDTFTLTTGGVAQTYRVTEKSGPYYLYCSQGTPCVNGGTKLRGLTTISSVVQNLGYNNETGNYHDMALQTCYGSDQRIFVFADKI